MANINKRMKQNIKNEKLAHAEETELAEKEAKKAAVKYKIRYVLVMILVASVYLGINMGLQSISYGVHQFRVADIMVALVFFEPAAFPGICIGRFIADCMGPSGFYSAVFSTCACAFGIYIVRWYCERNGKQPIGLMLYAFLCAFMKALELSYSEVFSQGYDMLTIFFWVMLGEAVCACLGGSLLYMILKRKFKDIISETKKGEEEEFVPTTLQ